MNDTDRLIEALHEIEDLETMVEYHSTHVTKLQKDNDQLLVKVLAMTAAINRQNREIKLLRDNPMMKVEARIDEEIRPFDMSKKMKYKSPHIRGRQADIVIIDDLEDCIRGNKRIVKDWFTKDQIPHSEAMDEPELFTIHTFSDDFAPCGHCGGLVHTLTADCVGRQLSDSEKSKIAAGILDFVKGKWINPIKESPDVD